VANPLAAKWQQLAPHLRTGVVANEAAQNKFDHYQAGSRDSRCNVTLYPLALESYGAWSDDAQKFFKFVAKVHSSPIDQDIWSPSAPSFLAYWLNRFSVTLRRTTAELIISSYYMNNHRRHLAA